jgi:ABC-type multidrug transport system ATPase subunit
VQKQLTAKASAQHKRLLEIARGYLTSFGFEGDVAVSVPVDRLSGGQKALLKFAVLSLRPVHILLLDEPTNHLDAEACESLAKGLSEFEGGIVAVTHDELLMYRLIHCNWTSSELLICRGGLVWCERNFGAHCLNALKNEVHRAENNQPSIKPNSDKKVETSKDSKQLVAKQAIQKEGELPPWLRSRRRKKEEKIEHQSIDTGMATQEGTTDTLPSDIAELRLNASTSPVKEASIDDIGDIVDSDATTEAPDASDGVEMVNTEAEERLAKCITVCNVPNAQISSMVDFESLTAGGQYSLEHGRHGHHSRFRKDLVNLNKAVRKRMQNGSLAGDQLIEFIKASAVGKHLRIAHGEHFDESRFVQDVLSCATKKGEGNASV